ncbi:hypothetical protein ABW21_db0201911 [Orbilia brochopaga]|nr:hypothetical protein ABW21_db0201911 [Drechslerella brochopaga]
MVSKGTVFSIDRLHKKYGPYVRIAPNSVSVIDIDSVQKIHSRHDPYPKSQWYRRLANGRNSISNIIDIEEFKARRKIYGNTFTSSNLSPLEPVVRKHVNRCVRKIKQKLEADGSTTDIRQWILFMGTDTVAELCYGVDFKIVESEKAHPFMQDATLYIAIVAARSMHPLVGSINKLLKKYIPHPTIQRITGVEDRLFGFADEALSRLQDQIHSRQTLFSKIFDEANNPNAKHKLTMKEIRDEAFTLYMAGASTTSATGMFLIWLILRDADIRRKVEVELSTITTVGNFEDGANDDITDKKLQQLPYLNLVITETLRLYCAVQGAPPRVTPADPRRRQLGPYLLPEGTEVSTPIYTIHRDPNVFPDPHM